MIVSLLKLARRQIRLLLPVLLSGSSVFAQSPALSLASGSAIKGGSLSLNLSLTSGTSAPAGLEWTLSYPVNDIISLSVSSGPALAAAGKTLNCNASAGAVMCLASGLNANTIASGVVAVVTANLSPTSNSTLDTIPMSGVMGTLGDSTNVAVSGTGSSITVTSGSATVSTLQCTPSSISSNASSTCTVTLTQAAPTGGATISVSSNNSALAVPASVAIGVGATTVNFNATAGTVTTSQSATVTASLNGSSRTATVTITPVPGGTGPTAAYGLDEGTGSTTADSSGNGITGQLQGTTWTASGKWGNALSFDGAASYVDLGTPALLQSTGSMTWTAWVNSFGNPPDDGQIVARSDETSGWQFKTTPDTGVRTFGVAIGAPGGSHTQRYSKTVPSLNTWYHVAGVYNAAAQTLDIYVNGVLDDGVLSGTVPSATTAASTVHALIGKRAAGYYFNGVIDNLRIYNRALSAAEIQTDMTTPVNAGGGTSNPTAKVLQCLPASVISGSPTTCTVTLSQAAPAGGSTVAVSSNNAALPVPASVVVAAGATTGSFTATAGTVTANQTATVTASLNGGAATAAVTVTPLVKVTGLQCAPGTVTSGGTSSCTVTLSQAAAAGGSTVALSSNNAALTVPASVAVAAGAATASFTATAGAVTANQTVTVTASLNGSATASVTITPLVTVKGLQCAPATVNSGSASSCTVTLSQAAPAGGSTVTVSSNNAALPVPASVAVAAGATTASFTATAGTVTANQTVTVTASLNGGAVTATVTVTPLVKVTGMQCTPGTVNSGSSSSCTVTLSQAAPAGGSTVAVSSNNAALTVPASVTVAAGFTTASFTAAAGTVAANQTATVTASLNGSTAVATVTITAVTVTSLQCTPGTVNSGSSSSCTVTLSQAAPAGGAAVAVSSNSAALTVPASVTVAAGATTASFTATAGTVTANQTATVTASLSGSTVVATVTITPPVKVTALQCAPNTVNSGSTSSCTVTLSQAAPAGGSTVGAWTNNAALTVPSGVAVAAGAMTGSFTATAGTVMANQSVMVTAALNSGSATTPVTVMPLAIVTSLQCSPTTLASGGTTSCTVATSQAAPAGGLNVALSGNSTALSVPASVMIAPGTSTASFTATAGAVPAIQTVNIGASLNGSSITATVTVQASTLISAYAFDEGTGTTTADASVYANTGQIQGATWTTSAKHGKALSFDGNSSYVDLGNTPALQSSTGSMTWSAWVYASGNPPDDGQIIARGDTNTGWQLKVTPDTGKRTFGVAVSTNGTGHTQRYSKTVYALKTWYHIAGVYNASAKTLDIYVNGVLDDGVLSGAVPASQNVPNVNTTIGKRSGGYYFKGVIDDVRVYSRALSAAEIQNDMNTAVTAGGSVGSVAPTMMTALPANSSSGTAGLPAIHGNTARSTSASLFCSPKTVNAGGTVTCELASVAGSAARIPLASSSRMVKIPAAVDVRGGQGRLSFQASVDAMAQSERVIVAAALGSDTVQDTILVAPSASPILTVPDKQFAKYQTPVKFQVEAADPAGLPVRLTAANLPSGAAFDASTGGFEWTPTVLQTGSQQVRFTASNTAGQSSTAEVSIDVDSGKPVLDAAQTLTCSPGGIGVLNGKWLLDSDREFSNPAGTGLELGGSSVLVNGAKVPLLAASSTKLNFLCPSLAPESQLAVAVETDSGVSHALSARMQAASPQIFPLDGPGENQGMVSLSGTAAFAVPRTARNSGYPAQAGDQILIWGTGFGPETAAASVSVTMGGVRAEVGGVTAVPDHAGLYTVAVNVPAAIFGEAIPVRLQVATPDGKLFTSNTVTVAVESSGQ